MSVILDIDLDYFPLFDQPVDELERLLSWAGRPVDFVVEHHHEALQALEADGGGARDRAPSPYHPC